MPGQARNWTKGGGLLRGLPVAKSGSLRMVNDGPRSLAGAWQGLCPWSDLLYGRAREPWNVACSMKTGAGDESATINSRSRICAADCKNLNRKFA